MRQGQHESFEAKDMPASQHSEPTGDKRSGKVKVDALVLMPLESIDSVAALVLYLILAGGPPLWDGCDAQ